VNVAASTGEGTVRVAALVFGRASPVVERASLASLSRTLCLALALVPVLDGPGEQQRRPPAQAGRDPGVEGAPVHAEPVDSSA
jgi:hypothetical protein